jgi:beta-glucanase (GH16 family)
MSLFIQIILYVLAVSGILFGQNWELVWSDEFNGTTLDENSWTREVGGDGWGNNELQYYTSRDVNSFLENGHLVIQALEENYGGREYTSARIKTQNKRFFKYGKFEASLKLPYGQGLWPAFWMLGQNISTVGWPACGEIDIMEMIGGPNRDNTSYGTAHWEDNGQHLQSGGDYTLSTGIFADDFHKFTIIWEYQIIRWYVDDNLLYTFNITPFDRTEFHREFFILLNVAVGGNWPGSPDPSTVFPQRMEIDYVRVYEQVTDAKDESNIPVQFELYQNYPNPFNPETIIKYSVPNNSYVSINIYNALGEKVAALVNEERPVGNFEVKFSAKGGSASGGNAWSLPSGIYFYKIQARSLTSDLSSFKQNTDQTFVKTKKMVLMR